MPTLEPSTELREQADATACTHCELPVPRGLREPTASQQFCCGGCRAAWQLIHANGLDAYYAMADPRSEAFPDDRDGSTDGRFSEFDRPVFLEQFAKPIDNELHEITLLLDGIHCSACIWLIEKLPQIVSGVQSTTLNWSRHSATIRWNQDNVRLSQVARVLQQLGYTPHPLNESDRDVRRQAENHRQLIRIGIAAAAAGNNMLIAASLYLGMFSYMSLGMTQLLRVASCVVGVASLLGPGRVFLRGAVSAIRTWTPHMDLPIALGLLVGTVAGVVNTVRGVGEIWFDSLSVLILLLLVGRWIQFRQQHRAADAVEMLYRLTPKTARRLVNGQAIETFVDLIEVDDLLVLQAGDLVPVDAVVTEGSTKVNESILSGESRWLSKAPGDEVFAGSQNQNAPVTIVATATGRETRLSKIVELVEQASLAKPQIVQWANRVGGYFVVVVIGLALITLAAWLRIDPSVAVDRTVALLIVACPCALALATPLAISIAIGRSAKQKIMIKGGDVFQPLTRPGMLWLDKTGTITDGELEVVHWFGDTRIQTMVATLERKSAHCVAKAIVKYARQQETATAKRVNIQTLCFIDQLRRESVTDVAEEAGLGIRGKVDGREVVVGNRRFVRSQGIAIHAHQQRMADRILNEGLSPCWVAVDGQVSGLLAIGDKIRADTQTSIDQLRSAGWEVGILSGDHETIVNQVASRLSIPHDLAHGGLSPEAKTDAIQESFVRYPTVVMVGDGVNDSAALAAASVGIAVHNGAEASLAAAPVYLGEEGLKPILKLLQISGSARRVMRRNLAVSLAYNILGATFAAIGWINPLVAAILMPISSLTVVAISLTAGQPKQQKVHA